MPGQRLDRREEDVSRLESSEKAGPPAGGAAGKERSERIIPLRTAGQAGSCRWEGRVAVSLPQFLGGLTEGAHEPGIGVIERFARCLGGRVDARRWRAGD